MSHNFALYLLLFADDDILRGVFHQCQTSGQETHPVMYSIVLISTCHFVLSYEDKVFYKPWHGIMISTHLTRGAQLSKYTVLTNKLHKTLELLMATVKVMQP